MNTKVEREADAFGQGGEVCDRPAVAPVAGVLVPPWAVAQVGDGVLPCGRAQRSQRPLAQS